MESREGEPRQEQQCANCGHGITAHEFGPQCIGNRNLCVCQRFWLPNGGHDDTCAYVAGIGSRCTCA